MFYKLAEQYDEILYLDFDVVTMHDDNFFEAWNLSKGIAIQHNTHKVIIPMDAVTERCKTCRSPTTKYYNACLDVVRDLNPKHNVVNTGIVGASKEYTKKLKYFDNFDSDMTGNDRIN